MAALAFAIVAATPTLACASTQGSSSATPPQGSSPATPTPMVLPAHTSAKLFAVSGASDHEYWYQVHLSKGQSLSATVTAAPATKAWAFMLSADQDDEYGPILSDTISSRVEHLSFEAEHTGDYFLSLSGVTTGTVTVDASIVHARTFKLRSFTVPASVTHGKSFSVSVKTTPAYNSPSSPLRFYIEKKTGGVWKASTWTTAFMTWASTGTSSKGSVKYALGKGTYRIRARFKDAAHTTSTYTGWKSITVT